MDNKFKHIQQVEEEINKCLKSPYYLATTYFTVKTPLGAIVQFTTPLNEQEFNNLFKK